MAVNLTPTAYQRFVDSNGNALSGGLLYTYAAGTATPIATYTDSTGGTPNANPIVLNTRGECSIWLDPTLTYKYVLQTSAGATIWTQDNISISVGVNYFQNAEVQLASAGTTDIGAAAAGFVQITGTTTITSFGVTYRGPRFIRFSGALTLTNNASTLILPGGANITTAAGDTCIAIPIGSPSSGWAVLGYVRGSRYPQSGELIGLQVFTAAGASTYTPSTGTRSVVVELAGGGGAGGGAAATAGGQIAAGAGGGAGGYAKGRFTSAFSGVTVTVGAAGAASTGAGGGNGGTTSFGALMQATGGTGGAAGPAVAVGTITFVTGGSGGVGTLGSVNTAGAAGAYSLYGTSAGISGSGGPSMFGGGGASVSGTSGGAVAVSYGAGGSGGVLGASSSSASGGNGAAGLVIVYEYA